MSAIDDLLSQYEKNKKPATAQVSSEDRLKKFFTPILENGENSKQLKIRILPAKPGERLAPEIYFHEVKMEGKKIKLFDPKQDGQPSPLNEVYDALMATGDEADKKLANEYKARKFYILKVIDRDKPEDGVKFWRFKHTYKGNGIMDKIIPIISNKGDITDIEKGRDLILTLVLEKLPTGGFYTTISSIIPEDKEPLTDNEEWLKEWSEDTTTWDKVYGKKSYEYLELVAQGEVPMWDRDTSKWVPKSSKTEETVYKQPDKLDESAKPTTTKKKIAEPVVVDPQSDTDEDDNLPF